MRLPPLCWWLRDPVSRASFLLTLAYLVRDRDMKLRVYPGVVPMLVIPFVMLLQGHGRHRHNGQEDAFSGFSIGFCGAYMGLIPMLALGMLQYSQHWQAADLFRAAPLSGPARLYHGARQAVLLFLALPMAILFAVAGWLLTGRRFVRPGPPAAWLDRPAARPSIPGLRGQAVPLSQPIESAKAAGRGLIMFVIMLISFALAGLAAVAWSHGWFGWFVGVEWIMAMASSETALRRSLDAAPWSSME